MKFLNCQTLIFFLFSTVAVHAENSFYQEQMKPGLKRAIDADSVKFLLGGTAATITAHQEDDITRDRWKNHQMWSAETTKYGYEYGQYAIGAFLALGQTYFDHDNGINHIRSLVANGVVTITLKYSAQRERPDKSNNVSFPSGHSSDAFTTATSLTYAYGWKAAMIFYPIATYVALSRVADEKHWLSDITAGAFIGVWMGRSFYYESEKNNEPEGSAKQWQLTPYALGDRVGLNLSFRF